MNDRQNDFDSVRFLVEAGVIVVKGNKSQSINSGSPLAELLKLFSSVPIFVFVNLIARSFDYIPSIWR